MDYLEKEIIDLQNGIKWRDEVLEEFVRADRMRLFFMLATLFFGIVIGYVIGVGIQ